MISVRVQQYDVLLDQTETQGQGEKCLTTHPDVPDNMRTKARCVSLSQRELADLEKIHKLHRLVAYQRCSRGVFHILGKIPACVYSRIRERVRVA
jgi:hypothetical protein